MDIPPGKSKKSNESQNQFFRLSFLFSFLDKKSNETLDQIRKLERKRDEDIKLLANNILNGDIQKVKEGIEDIELSNKVLKLTKENSWKFRNWSLMVTTIGFIIIGISAFRVPSVKVRFNCKATKVQIDLASNYEGNIIGQKANYVFVSSMSQISLPGEEVDLKKTESLEVSGSDISIAIFGFESKNKLAFESSGDEARVHLKEGSLRLELAIYKGEINFLPPLKKSLTYNNSGVPPQRVLMNVNSNSRSGQPISIDWSSDSSIILRDFSVENISFWNNSNKDDLKESTIISGNIHILPTQETIELSSMDDVKINLISDAFVRSLIFNPNWIQVEFEAKAKLLEAGPSSFVRNLKPRIYEYLTNNQQVAIIWGALLWVLGILWGIKNGSFGKN